MSNIKVFIPISKIDEEKKLVYGRITEEVADKSGEIFDYESGKAAIQKWSEEISANSRGESKGNVRAMHSNIAAGKFTDIAYDDDNKSIEGVAKIVDADEWQKVIEGVYTGFSIGGGYAKRWPDMANPLLMRYTPIISEVSLVDNPCVPTAVFEMIKADGTRETRSFKPSVKGLSMPKETTAQAPANGAAAGGDVTKFIKDGKLMRPETEPVQEPKPWLAKDGTRFAKKDEATVHNLTLEATEKLAPGASGFDAIMGKHAQNEAEKAVITTSTEGTNPVADPHGQGSDAVSEKGSSANAPKKDEVNPIKKPGDSNDQINETVKADGADEEDEGEGEDKKKKKNKKDMDMADKAAYADADKKLYPIGDEKSIRNSWSRINSEKAAKSYSKDDLVKVKEIIDGAWKKEIDKDGAPASTEKMFKLFDLRKGLYNVIRLTEIIEALDWLHCSVEYEESYENDGSTQGNQVKSAVATLVALLRSMVEEETDELFEGDGEDALLEEAIEASAEFTVAEDMDGKAFNGAALTRLSKLIPTFKTALEKVKGKDQVKPAMQKAIAVLEKAGARHSAGDMDKMNKVHEHAATIKASADAISKCMKDAGVPAGAEEDGGGEDSADVHGGGNSVQAHGGKFAKVASDLQDERTENAALKEVIKSLNKKFEDATPTIEKLVQRVADLEKQPMPGKGNVRAIDKGYDGNTISGLPADAEKAALETIQKMTPAERAKLVMKAALRNPTQGIPGE